MCLSIVSKKLSFMPVNKLLTFVQVIFISILSRFVSCCDIFVCCSLLNSVFHSIPCMALQPLPGLGLPQSLPSTRPCFQLFSSILLLLAAVMHPSEPCLPIWFLVFPLVLCCGRFHLKPFLGSSLPPFLLLGPPTLVFWFLYLPRCLDCYIGCTVYYSIWDASVPPLVLGHIFFTVFFSQMCSASVL